MSQLCLMNYISNHETY